MTIANILTPELRAAMERLQSAIATMGGKCPWEADVYRSRGLGMTIYLADCWKVNKFVLSLLPPNMPQPVECFAVADADGLTRNGEGWLNVADSEREAKLFAAVGADPQHVVRCLVLPLERIDDETDA